MKKKKKQQQQQQQHQFVATEREEGICCLLKKKIFSLAMLTQAALIVPPDLPAARNGLDMPACPLHFVDTTKHVHFPLSARSRYTKVAYMLPITTPTNAA
ncbi:hypothetical protein T4E_3022 [Trichinella pseudospiralis]|uniref:Uncharacterized protein n=1 Tax=Trichinella pseudospiralis TaxID=6337 RepID=A0A0V0XWF9_TRIPS|nr:hypothetical protein T4E_10559 [Trichinella pseudospiralis]KRX92420.1 hypothetical protein T4E_3022 [Trichinella pseudospiralis]